MLLSTAGAPGGTRTPNLELRMLLLCPVELQAPGRRPAWPRHLGTRVEFSRAARPRQSLSLGPAQESSKLPSDRMEQSGRISGHADPGKPPMPPTHTRAEQGQRTYAVRVKQGGCRRQAGGLRRWEAALGRGAGSRETRSPPGQRTRTCALFSAHQFFEAFASPAALYRSPGASVLRGLRAPE